MAVRCWHRRQREARHVHSRTLLLALPLLACSACPPNELSYNEKTPSRAPRPGAPLLWPADASAFFTNPGRPTALSWTAHCDGCTPPHTDAAATALLHYTVSDYAGGQRNVPSTIPGTIPWDGAQTHVNLTLRLAQGFFEVMFPQLNQSFGVVSLPAFASRHPEGRDAAFSIDAALTQGSGVSYRPGVGAFVGQLIAALGRLGLASARERQCTGMAMAANGSFMTGWPARNLRVRSEWAAAGVGVVDMCYGVDEWMGSQGGASVVRNLSALALKWRKVATEFPARRVWQNAHSFIELFNELDTGSKPGTGDQYMAAAQAVAYGLAAGNVKLLCGAVTDSVHDGWRDAAADNGLLQVCDGFSYHSYRAPAEEERLAAIFRNWLAARGRPAFPLLVTEAGTQSDDWKSSSGQKCSPAQPQCATPPGAPAPFFCYNDACVGTMRPTQLEDAIFAWDLAAKAVEHKAIGLQGSFAFVLFYYAEKTGSFAMTGRDGTALRSLAAVAQAISVLSGATYVGDLPNSGWRVFNTTHDGLVAVISTGRPQPPVPNPVWSWYYPVRKLEGADGRFMNVHCQLSVGCQYENDDGLLYAYLSDSAVHVLQRHTVATQLSALANNNNKGGSQPPLTAPKAFVLRYEWSPQSGVEVLSGTDRIGSMWGYRLLPRNTSNLTNCTFTVSLHSLSPDVTAPPTASALTLAINGASAAAATAAKRVLVRPMGMSAVTWTELDLSAHSGIAAVVDLSVTAHHADTAHQQEEQLLALPLKLRFHVGEWGCLASDTVPKAPKVDTCQHTPYGESLLKTDDIGSRMGGRHRNPTRTTTRWVQDVFAIGNWVVPAIEPNVEWRSDVKRRLAEFAAANFTVMIGTVAAAQSWDESVLAMVSYAERFGLKVVPGVRQLGMVDSPVTGSINRTSGESTLVLNRTQIDHRITGSPAFWGFDLYDEPNTNVFSAIERLSRQFGAAYPKALRFVNLLPNYAVGMTTGGIKNHTKSRNYTDYVDRYVASMTNSTLDVLCMDHYPTFEYSSAFNWSMYSAEKVSPRGTLVESLAGYRANLGVMRAASLRSGVPFWNFFKAVQVGDVDSDPTEAQLRWQVFTSLAYGAKGVMYFCYNDDPCGRGGILHQRAPAGVNWRPGKSGRILGKGRHYAQATRINSVLKVFGKYLVSAASKGIFRVQPEGTADTGITNTCNTGEQDCRDGEQPTHNLSACALENVTATSVSPIRPGNGVLIGQFLLEDGRQAILLHNQNWDAALWPEITFRASIDPRQVNEVDPHSGLEGVVLSDLSRPHHYNRSASGTRSLVLNLVAAEARFLVWRDP